MKNLLIMGLLLVSMQSIASDKGNGGSATESQLVAYQAQLESVSFKIRSFFLKNETELSLVFPEFKIKNLLRAIKTTEISVVNEEQLIDRHGKPRTCLNFSETSSIQCNYKELTPLLDQPSALFVLVLHEYLGIMGVEETSPSNASMIDGYSISKRLAPYVSKVSNYDLVMKNSVKQEIDLSGAVPVVSIYSNEYVSVPTSTKKMSVYVGTKGATLSSAGFILFARDSSEKEWQVVKKGSLDKFTKEELTMGFAYEKGKTYVLRISGQAHRPAWSLSIDKPVSFSESLKIVTDEGNTVVDTKEIPVVTNDNDPRAYSSTVTALAFELYLR